MILILHMKHGDYPVYARNAFEQDLAYIHLFKLMDGHGFYNGDLDGDQIEWYKQAKKGDALTARTLLCYRSDRGYGHETIEELHPIEP